MRQRTMILLWMMFGLTILGFENKRPSSLYAPNASYFEEAPGSFLVTNPITSRPSNFTGFMPRFHPNTNDRFCDRGFAMDVSAETGPPAAGELAYIVPDPQTILDQYRAENGLPPIDCALGYVNPPCDQDCSHSQCQPDLGYWSSAVLDSIADPQYTYILFPPMDYSCLGVLHLPTGNNNGQRKVLRPIYDGSCPGLSPFSTTHPYKIENSQICATPPRIRSIYLLGTSNWTIAFMHLGGLVNAPLACNVPAMRIAGNTNSGKSTCNIIHKCLFSNMKLGLQLGNSDDNTIQYCVFKDGFQEPGQDSGGLVIDGNTLGARRNVVVGNEFINMNNGIGLPYSKLLSDQQQEIPGTVIANNDIYWTEETTAVCNKDFGGCIGAINYKCSNSETGIDIKNGTSTTNPAHRILILGNRIYGYRPSNPAGAGTGGAGEAILVHNNARNIFIKDNILFNNTHGVRIFPWKNEGLTRRIVILNNLIVASRPLRKDPYPIISGTAIRGSAHDTLIIAYNTIFSNGRSLSLDRDGTYILKCNTIFYQKSNCNFEPDITAPGCCLEPNENADSSFQHSIAYLNTWSMGLDESYATEATYPQAGNGTPFQAAELNEAGIPPQAIDLASYTVYLQRWTSSNQKVSIPKSAPTTSHPGPMLSLPGNYNSSVPGYCNCAEPIQGPDATNDPDDLLFLAENLPVSCGQLRSPLVDTAAPPLEEQQSRPAAAQQALTDIQILPNPNAGHFLVEWQQTEPFPVSIRLFDMQGNTRYTTRLGLRLPGKQQQFVQLDQLEAGLYFLQLQIGLEERVMKVSIW